MYNLEIISLFHLHSSLLTSMQAAEVMQFYLGFCLKQAIKILSTFKTNRQAKNVLGKREVDFDSRCVFKRVCLDVRCVLQLSCYTPLVTLQLVV